MARPLVFSTRSTPLREIAEALSLPAAGGPEVEQAVLEIVEAVRRDGDRALVEYTRRFDCPDFALDRLRVSREQIESAAASVDPQLVESLRRAADNIALFHHRQLPRDWCYNSPDGLVVGQKFTPLASVGIYVPGGRAAYPSSLLMAAVPARTAGVGRTAVVTPPGPNGSAAPVVLAAAQVAGVEEVYLVGGAQAIAALAFGTETIPRVDKVVGPGNLYVVAAKKLLSDRVGVDGFFGPSEVVILADESARPELAAADMAAQGEHGPDSLAVLVTPSRELAESVAGLADCRAGVPTPAARLATVTVDDLSQGLELVNLLAPEHLELMVADPWAVLPEVKNAGAILLGEQTPAAVGDYLAGPSHLLPTGGSARFSSGLGTADFFKRSSVIYASPGWLRKAAPNIERIAEAEGLSEHARSVAERT